MIDELKRKLATFEKIVVGVTVAGILGISSSGFAVYVAVTRLTVQVERIEKVMDEQKTRNDEIVRHAVTLEEVKRRLEQLERKQR